MPVLISRELPLLQVGQTSVIILSKICKQERIRRQTCNEGRHSVAVINVDNVDLLATQGRFRVKVSVALNVDSYDQVRIAVLVAASTARNSEFAECRTRKYKTHP